VENDTPCDGVPQVKVLSIPDGSRIGAPANFRFGPSQIFADEPLTASKPVTIPKLGYRTNFPLITG
jgi:hypothetical protein